MRDRFPPRGFHSALGFGFFATWAQFALFLNLAPPGDAVAKLRAFHHWDGDWFRSILEKGYSFAAGPGVQNNVAFLPGYPLFASLFAKLGLSAHAALATAALVAAIAFWALAFAASRAWTLRSRVAGLALIASFPSAFYLVAAYSEGLFLALLLVWARACFSPGTATAEPPRVAPAVAAGLGMGLTRIVALCLCVVPLVHRAWMRVFASATKPEPRGILVAAAAPPVGLGLYLAYGYFGFGDFLLPFTATRQGWWAKPDLSVWISPLLWAPELGVAWLRGSVEEFDTYGFDRFATSAVFYSLILVTALRARRFVRRAAEHSAEIGYLLCAWALFALAAMSNHLAGFLSMPRYLFPVFVCLVFAAAEPAAAAADAPATSARRARAIAVSLALAAIAAAGLHVQLILIERFAARMWVAFR